MPFRFQFPPEANVLNDSARYKKRFEIRSDSSAKKYVVSFDIAKEAGYWRCSCMGCCTRGQCKHLDRYGLKGRNHGSNHPDNQAMLRELVGHARKPVAELGGAPIRETHPAQRATMRLPGNTPKAFRPTVTMKMFDDVVANIKKAKEEEVPLWTPEDVAEAALEFEAN